MTPEVLTAALIDIGRRSFYHYCRMRLPKVYKDNRPHLRTLCNTLQAFIESEDQMNLAICMPPRFGKSTTVQLLSEWFLGKNPLKSVITASYNERLSTRASKTVRNGIQERSVEGANRLTFSDFFPGVAIKDGDASVEMWSLEGSHFSYLATSPGGTVTGIGATGIMAIDDIVKNAEEAYNERILESNWDFYNNTLLSRCEAGCKKLVLMTRWATKDLVGRLEETEKDEWQFIVMSAENDDGSMLCDDILPRKKFEGLRARLDPVIFSGNFLQKPYDSVDKLYPDFKTYQPDELPTTGQIEAYVDTADEGMDYLAGAVYRLHKGVAYILDAIHTQDPMDKTEPRLARMLADYKCNDAFIESNNGGRGFARNVERLLMENHKFGGCRVTWFHQGANKEARILTNCVTAVNSIRWPVGWENRWPSLAQSLRSMSRGAKWKHDDAADMVTGIVEKSIEGKGRVSVPTTNVRARARI